MSEQPTIVWFQHDLRLTDNPALSAACERGSVVPVFVWDPEGEGDWAPGAASRWWLHHSLTSLDRDLRAAGSRLVVAQGDAVEVLRKLAREVAASAILYNRRYEPAARARQERVDDELGGEGFSGALLHEPDEIQTGGGKPYTVFTPFWKRFLANVDVPQALSKPEHIPTSEFMPERLRIENLKLLPEIDWAGGLRETWQPGEEGALAVLRTFVADGLAEYESLRDRADLDAVSRLSPHLRFGEVGPRQVWHAVRRAAGDDGLPFLWQVAWREFAYHLIHHFPKTADEPLRPEFNDFQWLDGPEELKAWQRGRTGYPIVDAGMRQLWHTGWMHNRVRMIAASFLTKDIMISWRRGAEWFWGTLVDADLANNTLGWQWTSGCGADAAPYFRVFNPVAQGRKFDPGGAYVRRWVPELAPLPADYIHDPWEAPVAVLSACGVDLGVTYPRPIVDHGEARKRALAAFDTIKRK